MDRREFVIASGGIVAASSLLGQTVIAEDTTHLHHDHGTPMARPVSKELTDLQDSAFNCLRAGEICLAQCNAVLAGGKTSMADCQSAVLNMLSVIDATSKVATYNTADQTLLKSLASVCADYCRKCEKECKPHIEAHVECKDCMDACISCAEACDAYVKA